MKKKLLMVIGDLGYGGAEIMVLELALRMASSSWEPLVLVLGRGEPGMLERLRERGVRCFQCERGGLLGQAMELRRIVRTEAVDLVHAHLYPALYVCAIAAGGRGRRTALVYTEHSTHNRRRDMAVARPLERWVYGRYDALLCVSGAVHESLGQWAPGVRAKLQVVANGVDRTRFEQASPLPRRALEVPEEAIMLLAVGRLRPEKNHAVLVSALARLPEEYFLVLAGDGPCRPDLERAAGESAVSHRLRFVGDFEQVESLYATADICLLPSLFEGFGLSGMEALAARKPLLFSDIPVLRDLFGTVGCAVNATDPEAIAQSVLELGSGEVLPSRYECERDSLLREYDLATVATRHRAVYGELVESGEGASACAG